MKKGHQNKKFDYGRVRGAKPPLPRRHIGRGCPGSRHYRKPHVYICTEVQRFAAVKAARRRGIAA